MVSSSVTKDNLNDKVFRHKPKIEDLKENWEKVSVENEGLKKRQDLHWARQIGMINISEKIT